MASKGLSNILDHLRALASLHQVGQFPDRELLERFIEQHDEAAFTALVERHGPMVLKVCRRVLHHQQDAEDACQAAFLVLVRKATSIRKLASLSSWLHGVAFRVALKMRAQLARTQRLTREATRSRDALHETVTWSELHSVLDEELQRLPEKYRAPLILCYLEAKTRDEAAQQLGWTASTLKGRLEWGRKLLRQRLARRGVALSTALLVAGLGQPAAACLPASLVIAVKKSALALAAGESLTAGLVAPQVALVTQGFLRTLVFQQVKAGAAVCLMALVIAGGGWMAYPALSENPDNPGWAEVSTPSQRDENTTLPSLPPEAVASLPDAKQGPQENTARPQNKKITPVERGHFLVTQVAKCGDCHTPRTAKGEPDLTRELQGGYLRTNRKKGEREREREDDTPDITSSGRAGKWSEDKMVRFLAREGREDTRISAHRLSAEDAQAVAAYLRSLPGRKKGGGKRDDD